MKRALNALVAGSLGALVAGLVSFAPAEALAQDADMSFDLDEAEEAEAEAADMDFTVDDTEGAEGGSGDVFDELSEPTGPQDAVAEERPTRTAEAREEIYAVQQIYALRLNRLEVAPSAAFSLNDPFVSHPAIAIAANFWITNVLAIGANFLWHEGFESESDLNFFTRRSTRLAVPVSQYQFGVHLNFTYVPLYGKFSMFNEFIFQWDSYIVGGVGLMNTRPVPVVDPEIRSFDYDIRLAFNLGIGIRVFVSRWLSIFGEIRNYMFLDQLESLEVALGDARADESTWTQDGVAFTSNFMVHLGFTIFLPLEFEYRLPR